MPSMRHTNQRGLVLQKHKEGSGMNIQDKLNHKFRSLTLERNVS